MSEKPTIHYIGEADFKSIPLHAVVYVLNHPRLQPGPRLIQTSLVLSKFEGGFETYYSIYRQIDHNTETKTDIVEKEKETC